MFISANTGRAFDKIHYHSKPNSQQSRNKRGIPYLVNAYTKNLQRTAPWTVKQQKEFCHQSPSLGPKRNSAISHHPLAQPNAQGEFPMGVCRALAMAKWHFLRNHSPFSISYHHLHKLSSISWPCMLAQPPRMSNVTLPPWLRTAAATAYPPLSKNSGCFCGNSKHRWGS